MSRSDAAINGTDVPTSCDALDDQDLRVLALFAAGLSTPTVAHRLNTSPRTLQRRISHLRARIGVRTTVEAVAWAARRQLI